jgi:hypothetical protein
MIMMMIMTTNYDRDDADNHDDDDNGANDYDNGDTTDDIPLAGDEYDMDNLGSSPDDEDDKRAMTSTINNVEVTPLPACDGHDGSSPDLEDE